MEARPLTNTVRARGAILAEAPPLAVAPCGAGVGTKSADQAASQKVNPRWCVARGLPLEGGRTWTARVGERLLMGMEFLLGVMKIF